ncbi:MAG TPA: BTAD domain-containing putative transcriptional regulator [Solirubrobacteraceae bacterium]|nr:BTAD domain-containing putative transcriptional regulator [Solirubrobacteraceae bacterium]
MPVPPTLSATQLAAIVDPAALLDHAWALEPEMRLSERRDALARLQELLDDGEPPPAPSGRTWRLELLAEQAIDASAALQLDVADDLAARVLAEADPSQETAIVRALLARARAVAWRGTDATTRQADRIFVEVAERLRAMGHSEWLGFALFWRGNTIYLENGDLRRAEELMGEALTVLGADSPRRSTVLVFHADALSALGELDAAERALDEAQAIADRDDDAKSVAYAAWGRAALASLRGDALATERLLREVERDARDWFEGGTGATFLADAAEMLDRLGLSTEAGSYLARALDRAPENEFVRQARATLLARSGDPMQALDALQELTRGDWLQKRLIWRHTALTAWATFRAGRDGSGWLAARALEQAHANGGPAVAPTGEPQLIAALAPLAEDAGSRLARELLLDGRELLVRLFGTPRVTRADGSVVELPAGKPGELVRMLALHNQGLPVEVVLERFFPEVPPTASRQRLRQVLTRLRAAAGEIVVRSDDTLRLVPAWVDVREFHIAADRGRPTRGSSSVQYAYAALALHSGPLLPADPYAEWAQEARDQAEYRHLALLDLVAADAAARGSHQEALTALEAAREEDPFDPDRNSEIARQLRALGRDGAARYLTGPEPDDDPDE